MKVFDCIIIGGGPSGLSASLTLGRARRKIALFDDGTNRNRVTHESHGFITRDGVKPQEFKEIGLKELENYPSVSYFKKTITEIIKDIGNEKFIVKTTDNQEFVRPRNHAPSCRLSRLAGVEVLRGLTAAWLKLKGAVDLGLYRRAGDAAAGYAVLLESPMPAAMPSCSTIAAPRFSPDRAG